MIATLGRLDELEASGQLDRLLRSGARFVQQAMVLDAARTGDALAVAVRRIGPALLFERLWQETGCHSVITALARGRGHRFSLERAVFFTVLHRLMRGGSDLAADRWREDYRIAGSDALVTAPSLSCHGLARRGHCPPISRTRATPFAPRCTKDLIEEQLFAHRRDLFSRLDLVFLDTTSLYFEGHGGQIARRARLQQGPSARPASDDPRRGDRRRRTAGVLGDVARQHRRCDHAGAGDRSAAPALRHWPRSASSPIAA